LTARGQAELLRRTDARPGSAPSAPPPASV